MGMRELDIVKIHILKKFTDFRDLITTKFLQCFGSTFHLHRTGQDE